MTVNLKKLWELMRRRFSMPSSKKHNQPFDGPSTKLRTGLRTQPEYEKNRDDSSTNVAQKTALVPSVQEDKELDSKRVTDESLVEIPSELAILPLRSVVVYPLTALPLTVGRPRSIRLIDDAVLSKRMIGLVAAKDPEEDDPGPDDVYRVGTAALVHRLRKAPDGTVILLVQGLERIKIREFTQAEPYLKARVEIAPDFVEETVEVEALMRNIAELFRRLVSLVPHIPDELIMLALNVDDPRQLVYAIATYMRMDLDDAQEILEIDEVTEKLHKLMITLNRELEVLELGKKIQTEAQTEMTKVQREYFLREQLKAIKKELGEEDEQTMETEEIRQKIEAAGMPEEAEKEAKRELDRLSKLPTAAAEYSVIRTYLDWLVNLPWSKSTEDNLDIARARRVLDEDHYDLDDIKERILEYLAVRKLRLERKEEEEEEEPVDYIRREREGVILCFIGPPGTGKTSLGRSIARALGRKFVRQSLGGVRDEAEIRGHRRTYIGALPGRIIQALRRVESKNPIFMLDEIDKVGQDWRGDPSSALLEVLDPEQNRDFRDHYLDVPFDLSQVMFITTGNVLDTIPPALRDRMEILRLSGYTEEEKIKIAQQYLIPRQVRENSLHPEEIEFSEGAIRKVIRDYTREAGVRNLERELGSICRKVATKVAEGLRPERVEGLRPEAPPDGSTGSPQRLDEGRAEGPRPEAPPEPVLSVAEGLGEGQVEGQESIKTLITEEKAAEFLGKPKYFFEAAERTEIPGVATGVAWTPAGGDILFIEATRMPGSKGFTLTGQLGDVMKESAQAALSYVRSKAEELGINGDFFEESDIHLHVPAGSIPKDGPSAGVTMATALASLLLEKPVRSDVGMTGEITLRGQVLPVGGVKEKVLAAHRVGLKTVILPQRNEPDLDDVPEEVKEEMQFILTDQVDQVFTAALADC
jgi:ATP-dependent Lon protease